jgi:hypothetical protein
LRFRGVNVGESGAIHNGIRPSGVERSGYVSFASNIRLTNIVRHDAPVRWERSLKRGADLTQ